MYVCACIQVLWVGKPDLEVTWEPASSLPKAVIEEFENKIVSEAIEQTENQYGYNAKTILIESQRDSSQDVQPSKKHKVERPVIQDSNG